MLFLMLCVDTEVEDMCSTCDVFVYVVTLILYYIVAYHCAVHSKCKIFYVYPVK